MKKEISKRICHKAIISSLLGLLCVLFSIDLRAQGVISGRVLDVEGQPLAGVSVVVGDTNKGTSQTLMVCIPFLFRPLPRV